jgi:hypothetical protein
MQMRPANATVTTIASVRAIPAIRITSHNMCGGIRA